MRVILASASLRRRELLTQIVPEFEVVPSHAEEVITRDTPADIVTELASRKAEAIFRDMDSSDDLLIVGADTVVVYRDRILGKPKDPEDAFLILSDLSGDTHEVYTGVCLIRQCGGRTIRRGFHERTEVEFGPMTEEEIRAYIATGDPLDKAGAYGIQTGCGKYIRGVRGDYYNVVGLPLAHLYQEMKEMGCLF